MHTHAVKQSRQGLYAKSTHMKQGQGGQHNVSGFERMRLVTGFGIGQQAHLSVHSALGQSRGARGVNQEHI